MAGLGQRFVDVGYKDPKPFIKVDNETIIDKKPNSKTQSNNSVGEYVDFEEID